jgi:hypothetical protein
MPGTVQVISRQLGRKKYCHCVLSPPGGEGSRKSKVARGNPHGNRHHTRHLLNQKFLQALLLDFEAHGRKAIEECRKHSPLGYVKVLGHLVPREMQIEHSGGVKAMSDEQIERGIELIKEMLAEREAAANAVIEGEAEVIPSLPAPASGGAKPPKS